MLTQTDANSDCRGYLQEKLQTETERAWHEKQGNLEAAKRLRLLRTPDGSSWEPEGPWSRRGSDPPAGSSGTRPDP